MPPSSPPPPGQPPDEAPDAAPDQGRSQAADAAPEQPSGPPLIRIGTKERESAYAALNTHLEAGRLDPEEYGDRYAAVSVARTRPELQAPFADRPAPHPFSAAA